MCKDVSARESSAKKVTAGCLHVGRFNILNVTRITRTSTKCEEVHLARQQSGGGEPPPKDGGREARSGGGSGSIPSSSIGETQTSITGLAG